MSGTLTVWLFGMKQDEPRRFGETFCSGYPKTCACGAVLEIFRCGSVVVVMLVEIASCRQHQSSIYFVRWPCLVRRGGEHTNAIVNQCRQSQSHWTCIRTISLVLREANHKSIGKVRIGTSHDIAWRNREAKKMLRSNTLRLKTCWKHSSHKPCLTTLTSLGRIRVCIRLADPLTCPHSLTQKP